VSEEVLDENRIFSFNSKFWKIMSYGVVEGEEAPLDLLEEGYSGDGFARRHPEEAGVGRHGDTFGGLTYAEVELGFTLAADVKSCAEMQPFLNLMLKEIEE